MKRSFGILALLGTALFLSACDQPGTNVNRAANTTNTNSVTMKTAAELSAIESEVRKQVNDLAAVMSKNDAAAFEKVTDEEYIFINPDGAMTTRAERAAALRSGQSKYESVAFDDIKVRPNPYGTGAIVTMRATVKGLNNGKPVDGQFRVTQVWRSRPDGWKNVHSHSTAITGTTTGAGGAANGTSPANTNRPADSGNRNSTSNSNSNTNR